MLSSLFQFTHPGRGATKEVGIYLPSPEVSIHAPREGCDIFCSIYSASCGKFQFTHPGRGATSKVRPKRASHGSFNSRTPGGVRPSPHYARCGRVSFNSRTPGGVRPHYGVDVPRGRGVSIHAPREGCDATSECLYHLTTCFNSRTPGGVRRIAYRVILQRLVVSIHAPREGCDRSFT